MEGAWIHPVVCLRSFITFVLTSMLIMKSKLGTCFMQFILIEYQVAIITKKRKFNQNGNIKASAGTGCV